MRLTVLGCSGTFPGPVSPCSSYLVEHDGFRLVLDFGSGALGRLQCHIDLLEVDAIYVSHLHADHCLDLVPFSYALRYHPQGPRPPVPVYGPAGLADRIRQSYEAVPDDGLIEVFDFQEVSVGSRTLGPYALTTAAMNHPVESHALRLTAGGRTLVYSADTAVSEPLVELARGADLFLCEASWPSDPEPPPGIHLTGLEAGEHATRAGVDRLVLTHVVPSHDVDRIVAEARTSFSGQLDLATCGASYDV